MPRHRMVNGEKVFFTPQEEAERDAEEAAYEAEKPRQEILRQILQLENTITPRRRDEAILGVDNGWLASVRAQITALRSQL